MEQQQEEQMNRMKDILNENTKGDYVSVDDLEGKAVVSKQDFLEKTGYQIQDELKQKYSELQRELNKVNKSTNETEQLFDLLEKIYAVQYSMKYADEINIDNCYDVMNEIADELEEFGYEEVDELKVESRQFHIENVKQEVEKRVEKKEALNRYITRVISKSKWEIDNKLMMIIGRYFKSNSDYINIMKVSKKYQKLVYSYSFNPISECSLFKHMKAQHFYRMNDKKERIMNMEQYIYWYNDKEAEEKAQPNELFKYKIRMENNKGISHKYLIDIDNEYIQDNVELLEEWSELNFDSVLYDSNRDGKKSKDFRSKILGHEHLYFIVVDSNNNVFGHYHSTRIELLDKIITDANMFMFTLNSNGRSDAKRFKRLQQVSTKIYSNSNFYSGPDSGEWLEVDNIGNPQSFLWNGISRLFQGVTSKLVIGNGSERFKAQRVVVIEMT